MEINYTTLIGVLISAATFIWTVYQYNDTRRREQDLKEFENYHRLIKELVQPDETNQMFADRQAAIIYELRYFRRYYDFSYRTLVSLLEKWNKVPDQFPRLINELNLSIDFLKTKL